MRASVVARKLVAPAAQGLARVLSADRDIVVGGIGDAQHRLVELRLHLGQLRVERGDPIRHVSGGALQVRDRGPVGIGALADRLADALRGRVAFRFQRVIGGEHGSAALVECDRAVDGRRVLSLVDRPAADQVRLVPQPLHADAHARTCSPAASARRPSTKERSSEARSQPARGPCG